MNAPKPGTKSGASNGAQFAAFCFFTFSDEPKDHTHGPDSKSSRFTISSEHWSTERATQTGETFWRTRRNHSKRCVSKENRAVTLEAACRIWNADRLEMPWHSARRWQTELNEWADIEFESTLHTQVRSKVGRTGEKREREREEASEWCQTCLRQRRTDRKLDLLRPITSATSLQTNRSVGRPGASARSLQTRSEFRLRIQNQRTRH